MAYSKTNKNVLLNAPKTKEIAQHKRSVRSLEWAPAPLSTKLVAAGQDKGMKIYSIHEGSNSIATSIEINKHTESVEDVAWQIESASYSDLFASCSLDEHVRIWDSRSGKQQQADCHVKLPCKSISWAGNLLVVSTRNNALVAIDARRMSRVLSLHQCGYDVEDISVVDGKVMVASSNGTIDVYDPQTRPFTPLVSVEAHSGAVYCLATDFKHGYAAAGGADALLSVWDLSEMLCIRSFSKLDSPVKLVSFSQDARFVASASTDLRIEINDVQSGASACTIPIPAPALSLAFGGGSSAAPLLALAVDSKADTHVPTSTIWLYSFPS